MQHKFRLTWWIGCGQSTAAQGETQIWTSFSRRCGLAVANPQPHRVSHKSGLMLRERCKLAEADPHRVRFSRHCKFAVANLHAAISSFWSWLSCVQHVYIQCPVRWDRHPFSSTNDRRKKSTGLNFSVINQWRCNSIRLCCSWDPPKQHSGRQMLLQLMISCTVGAYYQSGKHCQHSKTKETVRHMRCSTPVLLASPINNLHGLFFYILFYGLSSHYNTAGDNFMWGSSSYEQT